MRACTPIDKQRALDLLIKFHAPITAFEDVSTAVTRRSIVEIFDYFLPNVLLMRWARSYLFGVAHIPHNA